MCLACVVTCWPGDPWRPSSLLQQTGPPVLLTKDSTLSKLIFRNDTSLSLMAFPTKAEKINGKCKYSKLFFQYTELINVIIVLVFSTGNGPVQTNNCPISYPDHWFVNKKFCLYHSGWSWGVCTCWTFKYIYKKWIFFHHLTFYHGICFCTYFVFGVFFHYGYKIQSFQSKKMLTQNVHGPVRSNIYLFYTGPF